MWKLILMSALGIFSAVQTQAQVEVNVVSFNIRYGTADDGPNAWANRKELLVETVKRLDPDILGLQECLDFQADYIAEQLPEYRWFGIPRESTGFGEMAAIFYKARDFAPVETKTQWLSNTPDVPGSISWDSSITRIATYVRLYHYNTRSFFNVFNTHFDHKGEVARQESAKLIAQWKAEHPEKEPLIIMGDFNTPAGGSPSWQTLVDSGLRDAHNAVPEPKGPVGTFSRFAAPDAANISRIDWVLFQGPLEALTYETVTHNDHGRYPSDHYPVAARFRLKTEEDIP